MQHTLIVFARQPIAGWTKTRLCPALSHEMAAALYECFLRDVLAMARSLADVRLIVAYTPETAGPFFRRFAPDLEQWPQRGVDLGERMDHAVYDCLDQAETDAQPPASVVLIGSDSPNLSAAYMSETFARLDAGAEVVLGPADDGGYYLIGLRRPQPRLLRDVPMSTATVLADTLALAEQSGIPISLLPRWYDVDTAVDLRRLWRDLQTTPTHVAPHTRAFLATQEADLW